MFQTLGIPEHELDQFDVLTGLSILEADRLVRGGRASFGEAQVTATKYGERVHVAIIAAAFTIPEAAWLA